jgi:hypothetical protein
VVGFTTGSRGEVPGKRKPVIRKHDYDNDWILFKHFLNSDADSSEKTVLGRDGKIQTAMDHREMNREENG